ncbi:chlorophyll synthesis pathway protein BchC [Hyphomonas sp.]|uniref:chlorophyll synthesis pathway protein BchC n=1 Tax=Hyphomonas sp. TaxID=87 RepID=UPI00391B8351
METGVIESHGPRPAQPSSGQRASARIECPRLARAVVFDGKSGARLSQLDLKPRETGDVAVETLWSGISTGTERLMWSGEMPPFPGMGYPLVPGYEAVGRIIHAPDAPERIGEIVFVPGARCYQDAAGLFGAAASHLIVPGARAHSLNLRDPREGVLLALAATAHHAIAGRQLPDLIIGHGVLGRLTARLVLALGGAAPTVWETNPDRRSAEAFPVIDPSSDDRRTYTSICDVSGDANIIDKALPHCARGAEILLAGFYSARPSFAFPLAFMKEMRLAIAAEWAPEDLAVVSRLAADGRLSLAGLITHTVLPEDAGTAYRQAFSDPACLKMLMDWRHSDV